MSARRDFQERAGTESAKGRSPLHTVLRCVLCRCLPGVVIWSLSAGGVALADPREPSPAETVQTSQPSASKTRIGIRGFVDGGFISLNASQSFQALTGDASGNKVGGGAQVIFANGLFVQFGLERYRKTGSRAFVFDGEVFALGISDTITVAPLTVTGGYRFRQFGRVLPYAGGGIGSYRLREESDFAEAEEIVDERFTGYHVLGGAEFGLWRRGRLSISAAGEVEYAGVPNALGTGGISQEFAEDDLGGTTVRFKIHVGFGGSAEKPPPATPPRRPIPPPGGTPGVRAPAEPPPTQAPRQPPTEAPARVPPRAPEPPARPELGPDRPSTAAGEKPPAPPVAPGVSPPSPVPARAAGAELLGSGDYERAGEVFRDALRVEGLNKFTLPVGLYCEVANVRQQVRNAGDSEQLFILPLTRGGRPCFGVYWGVFDSRRDAQQAIATLPDALRAPGQAPIPISRLLR